MPDFCCTGGCLLVSCAFLFSRWTFQVSAPHDADKTRLLTYRDELGHEHSVTRPDQWAIRRRHILAHMQEVMGPLPGRSETVPLDVRISEQPTAKKPPRAVAGPQRPSHRPTSRARHDDDEEAGGFIPRPKPRAQPTFQVERRSLPRRPG